MARTKTVTDAEQIMDAPVTDTNPWKEMVEIKLPKAPRGGENFLIASVNGRVFKIERGVSVKVPSPIAEVIANSEAMHDEADAYVEAAMKRK